MNAAVRPIVTFDRILSEVGQYYGDKLVQHGPTFRGVDWNSSESQELRYEQLLKVLDAQSGFSINDYGCGYGALIEFLIARGYTFRYRGFDISKPMVDKAIELHHGIDGCEFVSEGASLAQADYTVASGIFNVRLRTTEAEWKEYVLYTIERMAEISKKGFAFNMLTKYSDRDRMRSDLYYADPEYIFWFCKANVSRFVSLLHDYPLYEFTVIVKK
jgi:hypothetical protein